MAIKFSSKKKDPEDPLKKYKDDQQSLTKQIIENATRSYRPSCDPHGELFYTSALASELSAETANQDSDISQPAVQNAPGQASAAVNAPISDFERAFNGEQRQEFASSQAHFAGLTPPPTFSSELPEAQSKNHPEEHPPDIDSGRTMEVNDFVPRTARTQRGTIEFVRLPNGRKITPNYNRCGMITSIEFNDGAKIVKSEGQCPWTVFDSEGRQVDELKITYLTFNRAGDLIYITANGEKTTLRTDGSVITEKVQGQSS